MWTTLNISGATHAIRAARARRHATALAAAGAALLCASVSAQTCPFDNGGSTLENDGLVLTRYALGLRGAPMLANTSFAAGDAATIESNIACPSCGLRVTDDKDALNNPIFTVADATIISRKIAGFSGPALTNGIASLGSGTRNSAAAVQSFLLSGCGATGGTVTSVTAGTGLTGGTITASGTIAADTAYLQRRIATACASGSFITAIAADGTTTCSTPTASGGSGTVTSVATGAGLTGGPISTTGTINLAVTQLMPTTACATNEIPKWNGSAWACAVDATGPAGPTNAWVQGGNAFGVPGVMGTTDGQPLTVGIGGGNGLRIMPSALGDIPNVVNGSRANSIGTDVRGATVAGGGGFHDPDYGTVGENFAGSHYATVGGGFRNLAGLATPTSAAFSTIGGGRLNQAFGVDSTVAGGNGNNASGISSGVAGGQTNVASGSGSAVAGGYGNTASGGYSVVAGGTFNVVSGSFSAVAGGTENTVSADSSFVAGGYKNSATAYYSLAAGHNASADVSNCAIIGLWSTSYAFKCGTSNVMRVGADKGLTVEFNTQKPDGSGTNYIELGNFVTGRVINTGSGAYLSFGGAWTNASDRALKENLKPINAKNVLEKVLALPVTTWNYISEGKQTQRMGPMAQDFYAAFGLGGDNKSIGTIDAQGVAFAAIKGLNQKLVEQGKQIKDKDDAIARLTARLASIERRLGFK